MRTALTTVAVATLLVVGLAAAQPAEQAARAKMPMAGMMGMSGIPEMTSEQMAKLDARRLAQVRAVSSIRTDIAVKQLELAALWREENLDAKKITAKVSEISALNAKLDAARAEHMIAVFGILTPEQRKSMRSGMRGMMQMMMPGVMMQGCPMMSHGMMGGGMMGGAMMDPDDDLE